MTRFVSILIITMAFLIVGCAPKPLLYDDFVYKTGDETIKTKTVSKTLKNYELGISKKCNVGDEILQIKNYNNEITENYYDGIRFRAIVDLKHLNAGKTYKISGISKLNESNYFVFLFKDDKGMYNYLKINSDGYLADNNTYDSYGQISMKDYFFVSKQRIFEKADTITSEIILNDSFIQELIYGGRDGTNVKVLYREYKNDLVRPAFFQDLTYSLKESDIIRYKKYKIKIHKATNEEINYTILED